MVKVTSLFISLIMLIGIAFQNCSIIPVNRLSDNTSAMLSKPENSLTKPSELNYRSKRSGISDQRLAELEALYALRRRDNALRAQNPMGIGDFDFERLGKRKRREEKINYQSSSSSIHQPLQSDDYISVDSLAY